jgi:hypothetical protein
MSPWVRIPPSPPGVLTNKKMLTLLHNFWFIQAIGAVALIFVFLAWNAKERKNIFILQSINLVLFIAHYWLLAAPAGAAMCVVVLGRNFVFSQKGKKSWASSPLWLYVFIILSVGVLAVFWKGWTTVLPVAAVIISMYAMWKDSPAEMRWFMFISCLVWVPYTIIVQSWPGLLSQVVGISGILLGMYRLDRKQPSEPPTVTEKLN